MIDSKEKEYDCDMGVCVREVWVHVHECVGVRMPVYAQLIIVRLYEYVQNFHVIGQKRKLSPIILKVS